MMEVTRTERGWAGHFCCAQSCLFRRNTLLECGEIKIVVSTVGGMFMKREDQQPAEIGMNRFYETMAFHSDAEDTKYHDADVGREISFESEWAIETKDADNEANAMHEVAVTEITERLAKGETFQETT